MFDEMVKRMDAAADAQLGNTVEMSSNSGLSFTPVQAFIQGQAAAGAMDYAPIDPISAKVRLKINKTILSVPDADRHRFRHPQLGAGVFRPENWDDDENGRYWLIDMQKA